MTQPHKKRHGKILAIVVFAALAATCIGAVINRYNRATDPHLSLGEWESSHQWWQRGKCAECHREPLESEAGDIHIAGKAPKSHSEPCWRETHGRAEFASEARCHVCHTTDSCKSCHEHRPATHTAEFLHPSSDNLDANRHIMLARLSMSSCLVCHQSLVSSCGECHAPGETHTWQNEATRELKRWPSLIDTSKTHPAAQTATE